jgi:hypothetical protein
METKREVIPCRGGGCLLCLTTSAIHGHLRITSAISANLSRTRGAHALTQPAPKASSSGYFRRSSSAGLCKEAAPHLLHLPLVDSQHLPNTVLHGAAVQPAPTRRPPPVARCTRPRLRHASTAPPLSTSSHPLNEPTIPHAHPSAAPLRSQHTLEETAVTCTPLPRRLVLHVLEDTQTLRQFKNGGCGFNLLCGRRHIHPLHSLILLAASLMLAGVVPAASANAFKRPSLLNDASHNAAAAHTHGFCRPKHAYSSPGAPPQT